MTNSKFINFLKEKRILKYGKFKLKSGLTSSYYCDIKEALGYPMILKEIVKQVADLLPQKTTCVAGSGYGGITLASLIAYQKNLPLVLVRDKIKNHGTRKIIYAHIPSSWDLVCIVDDVFTTGSSINATKKSLTKTKCKFVKPVVVLNRSKNKSILSVLRDKDLLN